MSAPFIPGPVRVVSSNVVSSEATTNEPQVENVSQVVEPLPTFGGVIRRSFIGKHTFPATLEGEHIFDTDPDVPIVNPGGVRVYYMDLAPGLTTPMHRTVSVDYITVIKGKQTLLTPKGPFDLKDGKATYEDTVETVFNEGDVVVQRGQFHAWRNDTDEWTRCLVVVIDAEKQQLKVGNETKKLEEVWL